MPLDAVVRLHFEGTVAYQNGFAANVSASGMYVKHPDPPPVGTRLVFEFTAGSQRKPVQGVGEVVWSRDKYDGPGRPAGAGIRFVDLDELSRQHITEAIFEFLEASLGDRLSENPEARALVASMPSSHAPFDLGAPEPAPEPEPEPLGLETMRIPAFSRTVSTPIPEPAPEITPFRIFDDEPEPQIAGATPAIPPSPFPPVAPVAPPAAAYPSGSGRALGGAAAARPERGGSRALGVVLGLLIAALVGGAVWWFFLRPREAPVAPPASPSASAPASSRPASPPLDPRPGAGRTLAESVGSSPPVPEIKLPARADGTDQDAANAVDAADEPAPARAAAPAGATPAASPLTSIEAIRAEATAAGTVVTITGDGPFATGSFAWSELAGERPRLLIKLKGMRQAYRGEASGLPTSELRSVRSGFHSTGAGNELHVVLDLATPPAVRVESVEPSGRTLVVRLNRS